MRARTATPEAANPALRRAARAMPVRVRPRSSTSAVPRPVALQVVVHGSFGRRPRPAAYGLFLALVGASLSAQSDDGRTLERALAWLDATIDPDTWLRSSNGNARGQRTVAEAMAAFCFVVHEPADDRTSARGDTFDAAIRSIVAGNSLEDGAFATWFCGSASFYLAERTLRDGATHPAFAKLTERIGQLRNAERAWAHGRMAGLVPGYPTTVLAASNWALFALGVARAHGVDVPREWLDDGFDVLFDVQAHNGGLPYGGRPYRIGIEAGRTAGSVLAMLADGRAGESACTRAITYLLQNQASVPAGHASPSMHVWNGALAAWALGDAAWQDYESTVLDRVRAAQTDDGHFDDIGGDRSPDSMRIMGDDVSRRAYVAAFYAAALSVPRSRLGRWLRDRAAGSPPPANTERSASTAHRVSPVWTTELEVAAIVADSSRVLALARTGDLVQLDPATGDARWRVASTHAFSASARLALEGNHVVAWSPEDSAVVCFDLHERKIAWHAAQTLAPFGGRLLQRATLWSVLGDGTVELRRITDGEPQTRVPLPAGLARRVLPLAGGGMLGTSDARIAFLEEDGEVRWRGRNRTARADVAASWTALVDGGEVFYGASTDGSLVCRRVANGEVVWNVELKEGVVQLLEVQDDGGVRLAALTAGGIVAAFDAGGSLLWTTDVGGGSQEPEGRTARLVHAGPECVLVHATGRAVLAWLDLEGRLVRELPCDASAMLTTGEDGVVYVATAGRVSAIRE